MTESLARITLTVMLFVFRQRLENGVKGTMSHFSFQRDPSGRQNYCRRNTRISLERVSAPDAR